MEYRPEEGDICLFKAYSSDRYIKGKYIYSYTDPVRDGVYLVFKVGGKYMTARECVPYIGRNSSVYKNTGKIDISI